MGQRKDRRLTLVESSKVADGIVMAQYSTFYVPLADNGEIQETMNAFLRSHRVLKVDKVFADNGWAFCVEWLDGAASFPHSGRSAQRVDYREVLEPAAFAVFSKLRERRKTLANADGVPPYMVMTDAQLAAIAQLKERTLAALKAVEGIGEARADKYGKAFLTALDGAEVKVGPSAGSGIDKKSLLSW